MINAYNAYLLEDLKETDDSESLDIDGIILKYFLRKQG
jgi:hypothetical protein